MIGAVHTLPRERTWLRAEIETDSVIGFERGLTYK